MTHKQTNPVALAGADRALNINAFGTGVDDGYHSVAGGRLQTETDAAWLIARRFLLSLSHARVVCELAGLGGQAR